jgi:hypothetical protein
VVEGEKSGETCSTQMLLISLTFLIQGNLFQQSQSWGKPLSIFFLALEAGKGQGILRPSGYGRR